MKLKKLILMYLMYCYRYLKMVGLLMAKAKQLTLKIAL